MLLTIGLTLATVFALAFVLALVIHFVLLQTDRFNWLEAPKRSSQSSVDHAG